MTMALMKLSNKNDDEHIIISKSLSLTNCVKKIETNYFSISLIPPILGAMKL